jgi:hypothetical protein
MAEQFLSVPDRQKLARIIENLYEMNMGPDGKFSLLDRAGLRRFVPGTNLSAAPSVLAGVLIGKLEPYGMLPNQPNFHALGALVNYALTQPDTAQDDARFLAEMLVKYQLIADPEYLAKLRADHSLDVQPVRQVDPDLLPPTEPPDPVAEPTFTPVAVNQEALERVIGKEPNFIDTDRLAGAIYSAQAVGRIERPTGKALGTGFLVGPDLILTNYHVFDSKAKLEKAVIRFDYHANADGIVSQGRTFEFVPDFYLGSPDKELDFALVRVVGEPLAERKMGPEEEGLDYLELLRRGKHRGYLLTSPAMIVEREQVNIIQHPSGSPQKVVLTQNFVLADMSDNRVHYLADTEPGSSGSPVFNQRWEVVALHHSGGAHPPFAASANLQKLLRGHVKYNEGIPMRAILPEIGRFLPRK